MVVVTRDVSEMTQEGPVEPAKRATVPPGDSVVLFGSNASAQHANEDHESDVTMAASAAGSATGLERAERQRLDHAHFSGGTESSIATNRRPETIATASAGVACECGCPKPVEPSKRDLPKRFATAACRSRTWDRKHPRIRLE